MGGDYAGHFHVCPLHRPQIAVRPGSRHHVLTSLEHTTDLLGVGGAGVAIGVGGGGGEGGGLEAGLPPEGGGDGVARACGRGAGGGGLPASASAL